jgi:hypothetical protein
MNANFTLVVMGALALVLAAPGVAYPQTAPAAPPATQAAPQFKPEELDQLLAPIALYPDQLLAQMLMASTYPLEIVQAERWQKLPANAKLKGDQLAAALEQQPWDPSVMSLVPFPQVLQMMNDQLDWTQRLGDAFLAQQADVMDSVQRLRKQAQTAGQLKTTEQQKVVVEKETIVIQPANPQVVYVPAYNPTVVYGTWPYPAYPPVYYPPPPYYYPGAAFVSGMAFATGVAVVGSMWGWGNCNWGRGSGSVNINYNTYNQINVNNIKAGRATQLPANSNNWQHNSAHRRGVPYSNTAVQQQFRGASATSTATRQNYRGYNTGQATTGQIGAQLPARTGAGASAAQRPTGATGSAAARQRPSGTTGGAAAAQRPSGATGAVAAQRPSGATGPAAAQRPSGATGAAAAQRPSGATGAAAAQRPSGATGATRPTSPAGAQRPAPAAFSGIGSGADARAQSARGQASRQSAARPAPAAATGGRRR